MYSICISQRAKAWITQFYLQIYHASMPACLSFISVHQMAPPLTGIGNIQLQLTNHLSTRRDERLSWPGWLTYSRHFSDHPSATRLSQDSESSPAKDRRSLIRKCGQMWQFLANVLRYVRYMLSAVRLLSVCCLSVCDVGAPYSGG